MYGETSVQIEETEEKAGKEPLLMLLAAGRNNVLQNGVAGVGVGRVA